MDSNMMKLIILLLILFVASSVYTSPIQGDFEVEVINTDRKPQTKFTDEFDDYDDDTTVQEITFPPLTTPRPTEVVGGSGEENYCDGARIMAMCLPYINDIIRRIGISQPSMMRGNWISILCDNAEVIFKRKYVKESNLSESLRYFFDCSKALGNADSSRACVNEALRICDGEDEDKEKMRKSILYYVDYCEDGTNCVQFEDAHDKLSECLMKLAVRPNRKPNENPICTHLSKSIGCSYKSFVDCPALWNRVRGYLNTTGVVSSPHIRKQCPDLVLPDERPVPGPTTSGQGTQSQTTVTPVFTVWTTQSPVQTTEVPTEGESCSLHDVMHKCTYYVQEISHEAHEPAAALMNSKWMNRLCSEALSRAYDTRACVQGELATCKDDGFFSKTAIKDNLLYHLEYCEAGEGCDQFNETQDKISQCLHDMYNQEDDDFDYCDNMRGTINCHYSNMWMCPNMWNTMRDFIDRMGYVKEGLDHACPEVNLPGPQPTNPTPEPTHTPTKAPHTTKPSGRCVYDCQGMEDGDYQSCDSCHVYVSCSNGFLQADRPCPGNLVWDDRKKQCDWTSSTCFISSSTSPITPEAETPVIGPADNCSFLMIAEKCTPYILEIVKESTSPIKVILSGNHVKRLCDIAESRASTVKQCVEDELASVCKNKGEDAIQDMRTTLLFHLQYCQDGRDCEGFVDAHDEVQLCLEKLKGGPFPTGSSTDRSSVQVCRTMKDAINCIHTVFQRCPKFWNYMRGYFSSPFEKIGEPGKPYCPGIDIPDYIPITVIPSSTSAITPEAETPVIGPADKCSFLMISEKCTPYIMEIVKESTSPIKVILSGNDMKRLCDIAESRASTVKQCVEDELASVCKNKGEDAIKVMQDTLLSHLQYCHDGRDCEGFVDAHDEVQLCLEKLIGGPFPTGSSTDRSSVQVCRTMKDGINCTHTGLQRCPKLWNYMRSYFLSHFEKMGGPGNPYCPGIDIPDEIPITGEIKPGVPFECPSHDGFFANLEDCSKYFDCVGGTAWPVDCAPGKYFHPVLKFCDNEKHGNCKLRQ